jgi:hypothetical protein
MTCSDQREHCDELGTMIRDDMEGQIAKRLHQKHIFVFGSNLAGIHGAGSALYARTYRGALQGKGEGLQGSSYAIPTKSAKLRTLPLAQIKLHVDRFLAFASDHQEYWFEVVEVGCGLAGYQPKDIAPMFAVTSLNVMLPYRFCEVLDAGRLSDEFLQ